MSYTSLFGWTLHPGCTHDEPAEQFAMDDATVATYIDSRCLPVFQTGSRSGTIIRFDWRAVAGWRYQVQYTTDLFRTNCTNLGSTVTATNSLAGPTAVCLVIAGSFEFVAVHYVRPVRKRTAPATFDS